MFNLSDFYFSQFNFEYFNFDAVFSDETENFRVPLEPKKNETSEIKIRVGKDNTDKVFLVSDSEKIEMKKDSSRGLFDYYKCEVKGSIKPVRYYFEITKDSRTYFYNKQGVTQILDPAYNFIILYDFHVPEWARGAVMYQIYVDRFYNGDESNDVVNNEYAYLGRAAKKIEKWDTPVKTDDICNFYGGDLQGVIDKMKYLKELGIEAIYFNPIFVSPSNHKYDIQDYDYVDPHYGVIVNDGGDPLYFEKFHNRYATMYMQRTTDKVNLEASNRLMIKLIDIAHKNGIRVILDGVFNHCGAFNKWLDKESFYYHQNYPLGAYRDKESKYHDYFVWYDDNWPNNDCYYAWWGHDNHPKLNYEGSRELYEYILNVGRKWVSPPFNADGWRLDVAADLGHSAEFNHNFWRDFRKAVKEANPKAIILAEHYGDAKEWLLGDQWDTVMNYDAFMEPITWFLTGVEKHSDSYNEGLYCNSMSFENAMRYHMAQFSNQSLCVAMNELSNHDHSRFLTRTNKKVGRLNSMGAAEADAGINKGIMKEAITFQMTWPGAPTVYYGDEAGLTGWTDPDNRRPFPWGKEDKEILNYYKKMISIHKKYEVFKTGSLEYLYMNYGIIVYGRFNDKQKIIVILNNNTEEKTITVPVWRIEAYDDYLFRSPLNDENYNVESGNITISIPSFSSDILINL